MAKMKFSWNLPDGKWFKVLESALIAGAAATLTVLGQTVGQLDFGPYTPMIVASLTIGINYLRQAIQAVDPNAPPSN